MIEIKTKEYLRFKIIINIAVCSKCTFIIIVWNRLSGCLGRFVLVCDLVKEFYVGYRLLEVCVKFIHILYIAPAYFRLNPRDGQF